MSGDFNNDGYDDLAVGVPGEDVGATADVGVASITYGSASGLQAGGNRMWYQGLDGIQGAAEAGDSFGGLPLTCSLG
ncbi:MAG: FG-GAP repeat protein [Dehalococcoidia bacterium]|nr:FG-GAP repeat protein [Dehalococcoidia bacterium]